LILGGINSSLLYSTEYLSTKSGYTYSVSEYTSWWDCNWSYCKKIIIDHTKVQADQTNFPVLLYRASDAELAAYAQPDGDDIAFVDRYNITQYKHEIEKYVSGTGELVVWVNVTSVSSTEDTILYMYYGNPDCSNQQNVTATWDSDYALVQHLDENLGTIYDSTSNNNDGINNGAAYNTSSKIDGGYDFDGSDYVLCNTSSSLNLTTQITLEGWAKDPPIKTKPNTNDIDTKKAEKINYTNEWEYILERENWSLQAFASGTWQDVDGLNVEYVNVNSGLKKFSLAFTASVKPKADYRLNLTINVPLDNYSYDASRKTFLMQYIILGQNFSFEYNYSDIGSMPDLNFDYGVDNNNYFWFNILKKDVPHGTHIYLDPTYGLIDNAVTDSWEYDAQEGQYPDAIRLGTSNYYLIVSDGDSGTEHDGYLRTIYVSNETGVIAVGLVDSYEYDGSDGYTPSVVSVSGDIYAVAYYDAGASLVKVITVTVNDANGDITNAIIDTQSLSNNGITTSRIKMINARGNIYAIAYTSADGDGWMETVWISSAGAINNSVLDSEEFDGADGLYPSMCLVDSDTVAVIYTTTNSDGMLMTYNISSAGIITDTPANS